jgi:hypothetical protein
MSMRISKLEGVRVSHPLGKIIEAASTTPAYNGRTVSVSDDGDSVMFPAARVYGITRPGECGNPTRSVMYFISDAEQDGSTLRTRDKAYFLYRALDILEQDAEWLTTHKPE